MRTDPAAATERGGAARGFERIGPASLSATIGVGLLSADVAVLGSRGAAPARVTVLDRHDGTVRALHTLPGVGGAWAAAELDGSLFLGTYGPSRLLCVPRDGTAPTEVARVPSLTYFFALVSGPDGTLLGGGYDDGRLYRLRPATGEVEDLGEMRPGERYVRSLAVAGEIVYAGVGAHAHLVAVDLRTGEREDILPEAARDDAFVYALGIGRRHIVAGLVPSGRLVVIDRADHARSRILAPAPHLDGGVDALTVGDDDVAYVAMRPTGDILRVDLGDGTTQPLGTPMPGDETRNLYVEGEELVGFSGRGTMWRIPCRGGSVEMVDLARAGLPPAPELPTCLSASPEVVLVGGSGGVQVHDLAAGGSRRVRLVGEPKVALVEGPHALLALYPFGTVLALDWRTGEVRSVTRFGEKQTRPRAIARAGELILVGTAPEYGEHGGALCVVDPASGRTEVVRDVVPGQSVTAIAVVGDVVIIGSEVAGGGGATVTAGEAMVAWFHLSTGTVTGAVVPVRGAARIHDLLPFGDDRVLGVTDQGVLFACAVASARSQSFGRVLPGGGRLHRVGEEVVFADGESVLAIAPGDWTSRSLATGLAAVSRTETQSAYDPATGYLYTIAGSDLVRVRVADRSTGGPGHSYPRQNTRLK